MPGILLLCGNLNKMKPFKTILLGLLSGAFILALMALVHWGIGVFRQQGVDNLFDQCYNNGPAFVYQQDTQRIILCGPMAPPSEKEKNELDKNSI